jgi:hypothetical protein
MSEPEWLKWFEEMIKLPPVADSESGWPASDSDMPAPLNPLGHENESDPQNSSTPRPSQAHYDHTPADSETPLVSSEELLAMVMRFYDTTDSVTEVEVTAAPHLHTLGVAGNVHARLSNVHFQDLPLSESLRQVDSPLPSRSRYAPYKIIDRPDIHRGVHDNVEHHAGPSRYDPMSGISPPAASLAVPVTALPPAAPLAAPITIPPPAVPSAVPVTLPPPAAPSLPTITPGLFCLQNLPQVKLRAKQGMKQSMFNDSFLLSSKARSEKALASLAAIVAAFNNRKSHYIYCKLTTDIENSRTY